jgi:uncharacterized cupin superfamily protein
LAGLMFTRKLTMKNRTHSFLTASAGALFCAVLLSNAGFAADEADVIRAVRLDVEKLAGINLPAEEQFIAPEDVLEGNHRPRGEVLHWGEQLVTEVYEDEAATFKIGEPYPIDEFIVILSGKLILTAADGVAQEFVAGDSLVVPKGFTGTWKMLGNYRELIVIERHAYEEAYGTAEE